MKRLIALMAVLGLILAGSGCAIVRGVINQARDIVQAGTSKPADETLEPVEPTEEATPEPIPEESALPEAEPTPTEPAKAANEYTSDSLGIMFTVPESWAGKYRVEDGDGYLNVYFTPAESFDETKGDGHIFSILVKESEDDGGFFDNEREIEINGVKYLCGTSTDVSYSEGMPEYETYAAMMRDIPAVFDTIRAAPGE